MRDFAEFFVNNIQLIETLGLGWGQTNKLVYLLRGAWNDGHAKGATKAREVNAEVRISDEDSRLIFGDPSQAQPMGVINARSESVSEAIGRRISEDIEKQILGVGVVRKQPDGKPAASPAPETWRDRAPLL